MRTRTCKTCGKQFIVSAGRDQYLCEECARKAKSDSVIRERTCRTCGAAFMGYPRSMYCPSCRAERKKQQKKAYIRNKAKRPLGSTDICALTRMAEEDNMKYRVEFGFAENVTAVEEWQTMDGVEAVEAENAEEAAKWASNTDGLENAMFRVYPLQADQFGGLEKAGEPEYYCFG